MQGIKREKNKSYHLTPNMFLNLFENYTLRYVIHIVRGLEGLRIYRAVVLQLATSALLENFLELLLSSLFPVHNIDNQKCWSGVLVVCGVDRFLDNSQHIKV